MKQTAHDIHSEGSRSILGSEESCTNYGTIFKFQFQFWKQTGQITKKVEENDWIAMYPQPRWLKLDTMMLEVNIETLAAMA
jgi:hypothetical protein